MARRVTVPQVAADDEVHRSRIPPPVLGLTGQTGPEGLVILEEVGGEVGAVLWSAFRAAAAVAEAGRVPDGDADVVARWQTRITALGLPVDASVAVITLVSLQGSRCDRIAMEGGQAASALARWAMERGCRRTTAEFAQLAAALSPYDAALALQAAQATIGGGDQAHAGVWLRRSVGLALRAEDWRTYLEAHLTFAEFLLTRGDLVGARRWLERALRRAMRQGLRIYIDRARLGLAAIRAGS